MKKISLISLFNIIVFILFCDSLWAVPVSAKDPAWLVDKEISRVCNGWNEGFIKCASPRGGYNDITENQKILNSWGYKARNMEEIKGLLPEVFYTLFSHPELWGTFRINETSWEKVKPRGTIWNKFITQSEKNKGLVYLDDKNWLREYKYGIPFPDLDENDPEIAIKLIWNFFKRYKDNDRIVRMDVATRDKRGNQKHRLIINSRLQMNGRVKEDAVTIDGLYQPNPNNYDFIYATPFISPYNLRGVIPLYYRYNDPDVDDDMWLYLPQFRRVRRMSTSQHQDRLPGGVDWTYDNTEGFEGHVARFNYTYMGRRELLIPVIGHSHCYFNPDGMMNGVDQYYQRRNTYVLKISYKEPIIMTDIILYLDPLLYSACYSIDMDLKGRTWLIQLVTQGRNKDWFYTMYDDFVIDILERHGTRALFAFSGSVGYKVNDLSMTNLKKIYLSR